MYHYPLLYWKWAGMKMLKWRFVHETYSGEEFLIISPVLEGINWEIWHFLTGKSHLNVSYNFIYIGISSTRKPKYLLVGESLINVINNNNYTVMIMAIFVAHGCLQVLLFVKNKIYIFDFLVDGFTLILAMKDFIFHIRVHKNICTYIHPYIHHS